jgi:putative hydrolase of the HAD superfamily
MAILAIVFDIGGVLEINPATGWEEKWERRLGLSLGEIDALLVRKGKNGALGTCSEAEWERGLRDVTGMDPFQTDEFMADLWHWYLGSLNVEMAAFFAGLRPRFRTGILSNSHVGAREREEERYGFSRMADVILYSHEVGLAKPDRRIYQLLCERMDVRAEEILFLDDTPICVSAARDYGIHAVLYEGNAPAIAAILACIEANADRS